jgi:hypothetical protein
VQEHQRRPDQLLASAGEHLADVGLIRCLRPGPDQADLSGCILELVDRLDIVGRGRHQLVRRRRQGREADRQLVEPLPGDDVAALEEQRVLALEVRVDRADGQAGSLDHVGDRGAVIALLGEDLDRGADDAIADLLFVSGGDAGHERTPGERLLPQP